jgi:hypothetical protein
VRGESLTQTLDVAIEIVLIEDLVQSRVEPNGGTARQIVGSPPTPSPASRVAVVCPWPSVTVWYAGSITSILARRKRMRLADTTERTLSDALVKTSSPERGLAMLKRWRDHDAEVWVYFAAQNGGVASVVRAQVAEVSRGLVLTNDGTVLRFDLMGARFSHGPLQAIFTPPAVGPPC